MINSVWAVLVSLLGVLLYLWFRFEWQYGIGAIASLVHDVSATIGIYALTGIEFNLTSVAAVLTIVGYSLNDTVVIYDRVRENLRRYKALPLPDLLCRRRVRPCTWCRGPARSTCSRPPPVSGSPADDTAPAAWKRMTWRGAPSGAPSPCRAAAVRNPGRPAIRPPVNPQFEKPRRNVPRQSDQMSPNHHRALLSPS